MNLFCIGISHHTAKVETRERFATQQSETRLRVASGCDEALILSTCNRVEVYGSSPTPVVTEKVVHCLADEVVGEESGDDVFYRYEGEQCARHLFRVAAGLDSMVIGETDILGQVKRAYATAREAGSVGPYLHRLFQRAFRVAKHVRSRTEITKGAVSVGSVAVDLAAKIFGDLRARKVLILGAGETSERTVRSLSSRGVTDIRVSNRSLERAERLAALVRGRAISFPEWADHCREIDILVSSTSAEEPLLTAQILAPLISERLDQPLFVIDLAVPRDVAPEVNDLEGVFLYDIDSLQSIAEQSLALRRQQISAAEEIIAEHVLDFFLRLGRANDEPMFVLPPNLKGAAPGASEG